MRPIILDGSTGAMLSRMGMPAGVCVEKWAADHPDTVIRLQQAYIAAGSEIVYAPTFGANEVTLARHSLEGEAAELNRRLAGITRKAAEGRAKVFGDLSPTGEMLEPMGGMTRERLTRVYAAQADALEPFVDGFVCETFMSLAELKCAYNGVRRVSGKPVFATISVDGSGRTMCGDALLPALISMQAAGVDAFGVNCVSELDRLEPVIAEAVSFAAVPFIFKPNAGLPETVDCKTVYGMTPGEFFKFAERMLAVGCSVFGGCCGTSPEFIEQLAKLREREVPCVTHHDASEIAASCRAVLCQEDLGIRYCDTVESPEAVTLSDESELAQIFENEFFAAEPLLLRSRDAGLLELAVKGCAGRPMVETDAPMQGALAGAVRA